MTYPTSNPVYAAHHRLNAIAYDDSFPILDRLTCATAALYIEVCVSHRVYPGKDILTAIADPNLSPVARAQEVNRTLLNAMTQIGIPIPTAPSPIHLVAQGDDGRAIYLTPAPSPA